MSPVSFHDWSQYYKLKDAISYTANSNKIINLQRAYGDAKDRRNYVSNMLFSKYKSNAVINKKLPQDDYFKLISDCLVSIFVPGARFGILDRGQFQYMSFGCATISPKISDIITYNTKIIPNIHYIECKEDFSDLVDIISFCSNNRDFCRYIGNNAKDIFSLTSVPNKIVHYIE